MSTLPNLPHQTFEVRGVVAVGGFYRPFTSKGISRVLSDIETEAERLGANAVVDVTVTRLTWFRFVITGTAVAATAAE